MIRPYILAIWLFTQTAIAQTNGVGPTAATQYPAVFSAEILSVKDGVCGVPERGLCNLDVHVKVMQILRDRDGLGLAPGEFEAHLLQWRGLRRSHETPWTPFRTIGPGQKYLILANGNKTLSGLLEWPEGIYLINANESSLEDVESILRSLPAPVPVQASTIAEAVLHPVQPHSFFLAQHAAALLRAGTAEETAPLAQALQNHPETAFSASGRMSLIDSLYEETTRAFPEIPRHLLHTYVSIAIRFFNDPDPWESSMLPTQRQVLKNTEMTPMQRAILDNYFPRILASEPALAMFHAVIDPQRVQVLKTHALEISRNPGLPAAYRTKLQSIQHELDR